MPTGEIIEVIRETETGPLTLLHSDGKKIAVAPRVELGAQSFVPADIDLAILRAITFPQKSAPYGSTDYLFQSAREAFTKSGFPESVAASATYFACATWFPEFSPVAPCLLIAGPRPEAALFLKTLGCIVRHPARLGEVTRDGFCSLPLDFQLTLLTGPEALSRSALRLLATSNSRDAFIPRKGSLQNIHCSKAIYLGRTPGDDFGDEVLRINLAPSRGIPLLDPAVQQDLTEDLQTKFLAYRLTNHAKVRASQFDVPGLPSGLRVLARVLGSCVIDAPALQAGVAPLLEQYQQESRMDRWLDLRCVVIEAVLFHCHDREKTKTYVGEITFTAGTILKGRGENMPLEPKEIGAILRMLSLSPERDQKGYALRITNEARRRIHELARNYDVASAQDGAKSCPDCLEFFATAKKR